MPLASFGIVVDDLDPMWLEGFGEGEISSLLMKWGSHEDDAPHLVLLEQSQYHVGVFPRVQRIIFDQNGLRRDTHLNGLVAHIASAKANIPGFGCWGYISL